MTTWQPRGEAELSAGWRLWLELSTRLWPDGDWDGTPAEAVRALRALSLACGEIHAAYLESGAPKSAQVVGLLHSVVFAASLPVGLWQDDRAPLDADRAALLHSDLAGFVDHVAGVRAVLAQGGGWAELESR